MTPKLHSNLNGAAVAAQYSRNRVEFRLRNHTINSITPYDILTLLFWDPKSQFQNVEPEPLLHDIIISRTQLFLRVRIITHWNFSRLFERIRWSKLSLIVSSTEYALYKDVATMTICVATPYHYHFLKRWHSFANVTHRKVVLTSVAYCLLRVCCVWCSQVLSKNSNNAHVRTEVPKIWVPSPKIPARSILIVEVQKAFGSLGGVPIIFEVRLRSFSTVLSKSFSSDHKWNSTYFFVALSVDFHYPLPSNRKIQIQ